VGGVAFGPFLLDERLASGGSAEVWIARPADDAAASRLVVKRLLPSLLRDPDARGAFAKEAALYESCRHPNIVSCFGAGMAGEEPWLAMELVLGADYDTVLRNSRTNGRPLEVSVAVFIARELLAALAAVHAADVVHRDVTPSNIFLSVDGAVKLGDFGIARYLTSPRTPANLGVRGKFAYLAPEQIAGEPTDARTDLFAVANVLAESLIGRRLFEGSGQLAVLLAVRDARLDGLRAHGAHLNPELLAVLERALSRSPGDRYPSAAELSAELARFAADPESGRAAIVERVSAVRTPHEARAAEDSPEPPIVVGVPSMFPVAMPSIPPHTTQGSHSGVTAEYRAATARVLTTSNVELGPFTYAELVDMVATGKLSPEDRVDLMGTGFLPLQQIDDLAGHLAPRRTATTQMEGPGTPDWFGGVSDPSDAHDGADPGIASALSWIAARRQTGALFVTRAGERKELYFQRGRLLHVVLDDSAIAQALVTQNVLTLSAVDTARAFAGRFGDDLGDSLVGLGALEPSVWQRQVAERSRLEIVELFSASDGEISFYSDAMPARPVSGLSLALGPMVEAGVDSILSDDRAHARRRAWKGPFVAVDAPASLRDAGWSPSVEAVLERLRTAMDPSALVEVLGGDAARAIRAVEAARLGRLITVVG
jgi:eukaryotic-like serine/threonine-protein kinase